MFDESVGKLVYRSIHFGILVSDIISKIKNGLKCYINIQARNLSFKRSSEEKHQEIDKTTENNYFSEGFQTDMHELYELISEAIPILQENNIIEDFITVVKCICSGQLSDNITLNLLFDVANFFSNPTASSMRYSEKSMAFCLIVKKLFKGKGVIFFRGYKGEGLGNVRISTSECKINFAVPSDPVLSKAAAPYRDDATEPGILTLTLDAFAKTHQSKDVKLSIDGKRLANGFGRVGDEDMMGHEASPTLNEKKQRLKDELNLVQSVISSLPADDLHNQQSLNIQEKR